MKTAFFKHDLGARNDPKIMRLAMKYGMMGIGTYWCIVEIMYEQGGRIEVADIKMIAHSLHVRQEVIEYMVEIGLFIDEGTIITNPRIMECIRELAEISKKRSAAIRTRWNRTSVEVENNTSNTNVLQQNNSSITREVQAEYTCNTEREDKIRKENKERISPKGDIRKKTEKSDGNRFIPPTLEEISAYIAEKGYSVDPERFMAYYESNGWRVGRNPMKSWRAALVTWERGETNNTMNITGNGKDYSRNTGRSAGSPTEADYPSTI